MARQAQLKRFNQFDSRYPRPDLLTNGLVIYVSEMEPLNIDMSTLDRWFFQDAVLVIASGTS